MPAVDAVIVAAIVAAFVIFAGVLAWAEFKRGICHRERARRGPQQSACLFEVRREGARSVGQAASSHQLASSTSATCDVFQGCSSHDV